MNNNLGNDLCIEIITLVIDAMKAEPGESFSLEKINLTELERWTGVTRARLRKLKKDNFHHGNKGRKTGTTVLTGFTSVVDNMLMSGVENSSLIFEQLENLGYAGGLTTLKTHIANHKFLFRQSGRQLLRRETAAAATRPVRGKHFRWTGSSYGLSILTAKSTKSYVSR